MIIYHLRTTGSVVTLEMAEWPTLDELRRLVFTDRDPYGEFIEHVSVLAKLSGGMRRAMSMYVDEQGALKEDRVENPWATLLYQQAVLWNGDALAAEGAVIYGNAVLMPEHERDRQWADMQQEMGL